MIAQQYEHNAKARKLGVPDSMDSGRSCPSKSGLPDCKFGEVFETDRNDARFEPVPFGKKITLDSFGDILHHRLHPNRTLQVEK